MPMTNQRSYDVRSYRTVFISDTHLGTPMARADLLLDFLKNIRVKKLYLVGDIIDGWAIKRKWYWDKDHDAVIRRILKMAKHGVEVIYVPGNHDEAFRQFDDLNLAGVTVKQEDIHIDAQGRKHWVLHGDKFDGAIKYAKWLAHVGDRIYTVLLKLNQWYNYYRKWRGAPYWSLSAHLKQKAKNAVEYIGKFEEVIAKEAETKGVEGVICGHIHHAEKRKIGDILYMNDGDWVESCTALVETHEGNFDILYWADEMTKRHRQSDQETITTPEPEPLPVAAE